MKLLGISNAGCYKAARQIIRIAVEKFLNCKTANLCQLVADFKKLSQLNKKTSIIYAFSVE